jgi:hypothetical protein
MKEERRHSHLFSFVIAMLVVCALVVIYELFIA